MNKGTPYQGRDLIIAPRVYTALTLVLYCNTLDSLSDTSIYADLVQPVGSGYAPIALGGTWASANGVVTYDHGVTLGFFNPFSGKYDPYWQNTHASASWSQPVTGAAIIGGAGPYLLHFLDDQNGAVTMTAKQKLAVNLSTLVAP